MAPAALGKPFSTALGRAVLVAVVVFAVDQIGKSLFPVTVHVALSAGTAGWVATLALLWLLGDILWWGLVEQHPWLVGLLLGGVFSNLFDYHRAEGVRNWLNLGGAAHFTLGDVVVYTSVILLVLNVLWHMRRGVKS